MVRRPNVCVVADAVVADVDGAHFAIHDFVGRGQTLIDGGGKRHHLEDRAGLVQRAHGAVHARFRGTVADGVGIERRPIGHGQNLPVGGILHDDRAGGGMRLLDGRGQFLFGDELDIFVDRQHDARSPASGFSSLRSYQRRRASVKISMRPGLLRMRSSSAYSIPPRPFSSMST